MEANNTDQVLLKKHNEEVVGASTYGKCDRCQGVGRQICAVTTSCLAAISGGLVIGYSSPALPALEQEGVLSQQQGAWFGSLMTVGAMIGGISGGFLADVFGRKRTIIYVSLPLSIAWLLNVATSSMWCLYVGRVVAGTAVGICTACVPVFIAEVSEASWRGRFGAWFESSFLLGVMLAYILGLLLTWRWQAVLSTLPPFVMAILMLAIPESPLWLLRRGRTYEALNALNWLRGGDADVITEWKELKYTVGLKATDNTLTCQDISAPGFYKPLALCMSLMAFKQLSGIMPVTFYTNTIFSSAGFSGNSGVPTIIIGMLQYVSSVLASFVVDKVGRRPLLLLSSVAMVVSCGTLGLYYYLHSPSLNWLSLTSLSVFIAAYSIGWGPLPWLLLSELLPAQGYGLSCGLTNVANWSFAFLLSNQFLSMQTTLTQYGTFWTFGCATLVGILVVCVCLPETKGRNLEEVRRAFDSIS